MTQAEWMHFRFGTDRSGDVARVIAAIASIIMTIAMVTYFVIGAGKFVGEFLGLEPIFASLIMVVLAMIYTVASGLYGVVWTDVFQGGFIFFVIMYISIMAMIKVDLPEEFFISVPMVDGSFSQMKTSLAEWTRITPPMEMQMPQGSTFEIYNLFGIAIMFYLFKVTLEGSSGAGNYMLQRYFAARSDREAGILSLFWTCLLAFRWPLIASFAMLGDIQIAEPGAIIGFAGRRVIEETVREKLPEDFQTAEYLMDHGMVDAVVARSEQAAYFGKILDFLMGPKGSIKAA